MVDIFDMKELSFYPVFIKWDLKALFQCFQVYIIHKYAQYTVPSNKLEICEHIQTPVPQMLRQREFKCDT